MEHGSGATRCEVTAILQDPLRLEAVRQTGLLDSPSEVAFDRITRLAGRLLGAPVALCSVTDDRRHFFKSCFGLPEPYATIRERPLALSFCQRALAGSEPVVLESARKHPELHDHPAVLEFGIGGYLGAPLVLSSGQRIGTFCVIDVEDRAWSAREIEVVRDLAAAAVTEIELRVTAREAERARQLAAEQARILERIATGAPAEEVLGRVARLVEAHGNDAVRARLLTENGELRLAAAPGIPSPRQEADQAPSAEELSGAHVADIAANLARITIERDRAEAERTRLLASESAARAAAESADERKDEFLAMLAHELRNPLAPLVTSLEILGRRAPAGAGLERYVEVAERQVHRVARLVDDLLDVSRITRGKIELRPEPVDLKDAVRHALDSVAALTTSRRHEVVVSLASEPLPLLADPVRLEQVLGNLLLNAAKYTDPGGRIEVEARREGDLVELRVRDSGVGIDAGMLPHVFDLFTQAERSLDRSQGGLGVGLTLVRRLVELHGGSVEARSEGLGRGSEFVVRLPTAAAKRAERFGASRGGPEPSRSRRVLVVDDNVDAAEMLSELLLGAGHEVVTVFTGSEALAAGSFRPEFVLLDLGLPVLDGYEVARRMRRAPEFEGATLVAVTGYGQAADRVRAEAAGFDLLFAKPVDSDRLLELVRG